VRFSYELHIPPTAQPGVYRWSGTVNGIAIAGDDALTVEPSETVVSVSLAYRRDIVRIQLSQSVETARLRIYDLSGALLFEEIAHGNMALDWRPHRRANGVYLYVVEIVQENKIIQRKLGKVVVLK
jgi:hypothetical protein